MEQILYFFIPIFMIVVGVNFLIIHKGRSPSMGRPIRTNRRDYSYASEPPIVFSKQKGTQEPKEKQEGGLSPDNKPYAYDEAQPLAGEVMKTEVMLPLIPSAWLLIGEGGLSEKRYDMKRIVISIGRSDENDIVLHDRALSWRHAKIRLEGKKYFIYDLASTNGTRVNGRKIRKKWIKEGDIIEMGHTRMAFKTGENQDGLRKQLAGDRYQNLSGNLEYFDLPFIIQTLATSEMSGTLTITDKLKRVFAMLYFKAGKVLFAKLGHLGGEEAFYQLFQSPIQEAFAFKGGLFPKAFEEEKEIGKKMMGLLMEAAHQQDELKMLKATYTDPDRIFRPQSETLPWDDEKTKSLAQEIWARLQRGETIAQMVREIPTCEYRIYKVLSIMDEKGFAA
jgi:hypothetical protein